MEKYMAINRLRKTMFTLEMCLFHSSYYLLKHPSTQSRTLQLGHHHCIRAFLNRS